MSLVTQSGREQLETARSAPDPEPIREDNATQIVFIVARLFVSRRAHCIG